MKAIMYVMAEDARWVKRETDLPFTPYPGMNFEGLADEQPLKISGMSYVIPDGHIKLRLAWLSDRPLNSDNLIKLGWEKA